MKCTSLERYQYSTIRFEIGSRCHLPLAKMFANINAPHRYREFKINASCRFWLFSERSISFILPPGWSSITTKLSEGILSRNIGILPIFLPSKISTKGLEWDVEDWETAMGGQVSTSNHVVADEVAIKVCVHAAVEEVLHRHWALAFESLCYCC